MKKVLFILFNLLTITAMAQDKGRFEVYDLDNFKLHVYYTNDALGDASYIIEGTQELVTMEQPLFRDNVAEFDRYLASLGKPVVRRITDYHVGGTGDHATVMAEGMPEFTKGEIYGGMMQGFAATFGNALADLPTGSVSEAAFWKRTNCMSRCPSFATLHAVCFIRSTALSVKSYSTPCGLPNIRHRYRNRSISAPSSSESHTQSTILQTPFPARCSSPLQTRAARTSSVTTRNLSSTNKGPGSPSTARKSGNSLRA